MLYIRPVVQALLFFVCLTAFSRRNGVKARQEKIPSAKREDDFPRRPEGLALRSGGDGYLCFQRKGCRILLKNHLHPLHSPE